MAFVWAWVCDSGRICCFLPYSKSSEEMGAPVQEGLALGWPGGAFLAFLRMLLHQLLAPGSRCGLSALMEGDASGWAGGCRVGLRMDCLGSPGATLGLGGQPCTRLSCSFHWGPEKPSGLVPSHVQGGAGVAQPSSLSSLAVCSGAAGSAFTRALSSAGHLQPWARLFSKPCESEAYGTQGSDGGTGTGRGLERGLWPSSGAGDAGAVFQQRQSAANADGRRRRRAGQRG